MAAFDTAACRRRGSTVNSFARQAFKGSGDWRAVSLEQSLPMEKTAILICDMWNKHWCSGATERVKAWW